VHSPRLYEQLYCRLACESAACPPLRSVLKRAVRARRFFRDCKTKEDVRRADALLRAYEPIWAKIRENTGSYFIQVRCQTCIAPLHIPLRARLRIPCIAPSARSGCLLHHVFFHPNNGLYQALMRRGNRRVCVQGI
jgi:hypothetical protein